MSEISALGLNLGTLTSGPLQRVGDVVDVPSGRRYKYTKFTNSAAIPAGSHVYAVVTLSAALAIPAQTATNLVAPSQQLVVTTAGAVAADAYQGGYALITSGTDKYSLRISHNTGTAAAGSITLLFEESLYNTTAIVPGTDTVVLSTSPDNASTVTATGNTDNGYVLNSIPAQTGNGVYGYTQVSGYNAIVPGLTNIQ